MEELLRKIKGEMELFKLEADKAAIKGNKAAGARSRAHSMVIRDLLREWRKVSVVKGE